MIVEVHYGGGKGYSATASSYEDAARIAQVAKLDEQARLIIAKEGEETIFTHTMYPRKDGVLSWQFKAMKKGI